MTKLIQETQASGKDQRAQIRLLGALKRRWELFGQELRYCYDIPGLPQDNLQLESLFGHLRRHQRRISGRKSTRELIDFGQAQVLFTANTLQELLDQIQRVPRETYLVHRNRLANAGLPRQFIRRLHHDPWLPCQLWFMTILSDVRLWICIKCLVSSRARHFIQFRQQGVRTPHLAV
jgi:hypothetical protein